MRALEDNFICFTTPLPPSVNDYLGYKVLWRNKKAVVFPYKKEKALKFNKLVKDKLSKLVKETGWEEADEYTYVVCKVKVYLEKKRQDSDNLFKVLLDSINSVEGLLYDDSMIIPYVEDVKIDSKNPRLEVELYLADKIGVFNRDQHSEFIKKNCSNCTRFKRNCGLLKDSVHNKVKEEISIETLSCTARKVKKT